MAERELELNLESVAVVRVVPAVKKIMPI